MDVIEELTEYQDLIDRTHVERRVEDWRSRIGQLYANLEAWLPSGWLSKSRLDVAMDERVMRDFSVPQQLLPSLVLQHGEVAVRLEPRALWIMGTNGRVDMVSPLAHSVIIDQADLYEAPRWIIAPFRNQLSKRALTRESFIETLP